MQNDLLRQEEQALDALRASLVEDEDRMDSQSLDIETIRKSPLAERFGVFGLIYKLFPFDSPWIRLGNDLTFRKEIGFFLQQDFICMKTAEPYHCPLILQITRSEDLNNSRTISWLHRTDMELEDIAAVLSESYKELHEGAMLRDENFAGKFRESKTDLELSLLTGEYSYYPEAKNTLQRNAYPLQPKDELKRLVKQHKQDFHSLSFNNSILCCGIAGEAEYAGRFQKYTPGEGMVFVYVPGMLSPAGEYIGEWVRDLADKTSFAADPKYAEITRTLSPLLAGRGIAPALLEASRQE
jgi:hypothetical protein